MGITENDTFSSNLRIVSAQIISENICRKKEMPDFRKYLTYTSFCAGWANGTGVCNGDSGGGFLLQRPNSNIWEVHGIVSLSPRRLGAFLCDPNYYTVFTKVRFSITVILHSLYLLDEYKL
jgi:secreted trypsin-like serine protease